MAGERFSMIGKRQIVGKVGDLVARYAAYTNPVPAVLQGIGPKLYRACIPPEHMEAFDVLRPTQWHEGKSWGGMWNRGDVIQVQLDFKGHRPSFIETHEATASFLLPEDWRYPDAWITDEDIDDPEIRAAMFKLCVQYFRTRSQLNLYAGPLDAVMFGQYNRLPSHEREKLMSLENGCFNGVNTPGQLYAIWPALAMFADSSYRDRIQRLRLKPRIPRSITADWVQVLQSLEEYKAVDEMLLTIATVGELEISKVDCNSYPFT